ncbi:unnamed protein product [Didymodactylos carnosus]|uniref:NIPSNAP domain-containing protein n=2 Tax=Didymodactylos carnosus TaxID=1234261 RepID=A0A813R9B9_9BILA|nr:unnamed protein product [Didymodactylos carnosus]CAF3561618.1 unnamed protein product [Didymodactylos carnosus]
MYSPSRFLCTDGGSLLKKINFLFNLNSRCLSFNPFAPKNIEQPKDSHSKLLTESEHVFEVQHHTVKPRHMTDYENVYNDYISEIIQKYNVQGLIHTGSWRVHIGNVQNQFVHIWMFKNFSQFDEFGSDFRTDDDKVIKYREKMNDYLVQRANQVCLSFSYWGIPQPRPLESGSRQNNIYEMRSYWLKPGTLIEWGNNWVKGIKYRPDAKVLGVFSQIGELYNVHHMWCYKDFHNRKLTRSAAWGRPGWDDNVAYTVPLIRKMESKILVPLKNSPMQ